MIRRILGAVVALTIGGVGGLTLAAPAQAGEVTPAAPWQTSDAAGDAYPFAFQAAQYSAVLSPNSALLQVGDGIVGGTELRTDNLGLEVEAGDEVSFHYTLDGGATCSLGAPRVFLYDTADADTMLTAPWVSSAGDCGTAGLVVLAAPSAATLGTVGFAYDNGAGGSVLISDLSVDGVPVLFTRPNGCGYDCATPEPTPSATPTPSTGPSVAPSPSTGASPTPAAGQLPVTGSRTAAVVGVLVASGVGLIGVGWAIRRVSRPQTTS